MWAGDVGIALPAVTSPPTEESIGTGPLADRVAAFEKRAIEDELERRDFHMTDTARALCLERSHLYTKCQQPGIELPRRRSPRN